MVLNEHERHDGVEARLAEVVAVAGRSSLPRVPRGADARPPPWMLAAPEAPRAMPQLALRGGRGSGGGCTLQRSARRAPRVAWLSERLPSSGFAGGG